MDGLYGKIRKRMDDLGAPPFINHYYKPLYDRFSISFPLPFHDLSQSGSCFFTSVGRFCPRHAALDDLLGSGRWSTEGLEDLGWVTCRK